MNNQKTSRWTIDRMKSLAVIVLLGLTGAGMLPSCSTVKAYQKVYLNDSDMQFSLKSIERYESNFQSYREGASGGNGGKTGGGCGCN